MHIQSVMHRVSSSGGTVQLVQVDLLQIACLRGLQIACLFVLKLLEAQCTHKHGSVVT